jgi:hypothetical protein
VGCACKWLAGIIRLYQLASRIQRESDDDEADLCTVPQADCQQQLLPNSLNKNWLCETVGEIYNMRLRAV